MRPNDCRGSVKREYCLLWYINVREHRRGNKKKENSPKLATKGTPDEEKENKTQHTMCWTPLYTNKQK
jgi:hypothetical protein